VNGVWSKVEDHAAPPAQAERFDRWVERACFQWRSPGGKILTPVAACTHRVSEADPLRTHRVVEAVPDHYYTEQDPQPLFSTEPLFSDKAVHQYFRSLADLTVPCGRVINTLLRLVHEGSHGTDFRSDSHGGSSFRSTHGRNQYSRVTPASSKRVETCDQSDIEDEVTNPDVKTRKEVKYQQQSDDSWEWMDDNTLVRNHRTPRRNRFSSQECESCPCDVRLLSDQRETKQDFKNQTMNVKDNWRLKG